MLSLLGEHHGMNILQPRDLSIDVQHLCCQKCGAETADDRFLR